MPEVLQPLEDEIRLSFIPALLRRNVNELERELLGLPARFGGMGILNPVAESCISHRHSLQISAPLVRLILRQQSDFDPVDLEAATKDIRKEIDKQSEDIYKARAEKILVQASPELSLSNCPVRREQAVGSRVPTFEHGTILHHAVVETEPKLQKLNLQI